MKTNKNILVVMPVEDEHKKTLEKHAKGSHFVYSSYDKVTPEMIKEANIIIGNVAPFYLKEAKNLEWLQLNSAGGCITGECNLNKCNRSLWPWCCRTHVSSAVFTSEEVTSV